MTDEDRTRNGTVQASSGVKAVSVLAANTFAFTICFAVWMMYGVLVTFLVDRHLFVFGSAQIGWLIGIPVLTGSLLRPAAGMLTDSFGGRAVMTAIMLVSALSVYLVSFADGFWGFLVGGLGFGIAGASFAAGVAYTSIWFPPGRQGTVLGVFGVGNSGAALTAILAPRLLGWLTSSDLERWRLLPRIYAAALHATAVAYWFATFPRKPEGAGQTLRQRLEPLGNLRVWRFGLYYFLLFGGFVALSQWLIPYYVNVYTVSVVTAGTLASLFALPSGLFRALGGWLSDRVGARAVMYWVLGLGIAVLVLLFPPRVELQLPGQGILAVRPGTVTEVSEQEVVVGADRYVLQDVASAAAELRFGISRADERHLFLPAATFRQTPVVRVGDIVAKGQLLVQGVTQIYFQANRWIFTGLVLLLGILMGLGSGAVFKHITTYFPGRVGVVGGVVGMLGALGGFALPILFGYLLRATGVWTTAWMLLALCALVCLIWMHVVIRRMMTESVPALMRDVDGPHRP